MDSTIKKFHKIKDTRGELIIFLRQSELQEEKKRLGQIYFVTFKNRGIVRGNHYHKTWHEWFGIIRGKVYVILEDVRTKERKNITLNARINSYLRLEVKPYIAHAFKSLTKNVILLSYADREWRAKDRYEYKVI